MVNSTLAQKVIWVIAKWIEVIETNVTLDTKITEDLFDPCISAWAEDGPEIFFNGVFTELQRVFGVYDLSFLDRSDVSVREIVAYLEEIGCT